MIVYKEIFEKLAAAGWSKYKLRKEGVIYSRTIEKMLAGDPIMTTTLDTICRLTGLPVEELIEYIPDQK